MICSIGSLCLAIRGDRDKYFDFLYFGVIELLIELLALGMALEYANG